MSSQSECFKTTPFGEVSIRFNVDEIVSETPFEIVLNVDNPNQSLHVTGYLEGKDMYMGKIPLFFESSQQQMHTTEVMIGSCSEPKMTWRMWLTVSDRNADGNEGKTATTQFFIDFTSRRI